MKIASSEFENNGEIPKKYTCDGADVNPPLEFHDVPDNTGSFVLIVEDPDAPAKTWVHWVLYNIPGDTTSIEEDSVPEGALEGETDFGEPGYGGPCPPDGEHRYYFKLYALDVEELELFEGDSKERVEEAISNHVIESCELMASYSR